MAMGLPARKAASCRGRSIAEKVTQRMPHFGEKGKGIWAGAAGEWLVADRKADAE
jgi:hypothetical protein